MNLDRAALSESLNLIHTRDSFAVCMSYTGSDQSDTLENRSDESLEGFCRKLKLHVDEDGSISGLLTISITKGFQARTATIYSLKHIEKYWREGGVGQAATKLKSLSDKAYILESTEISTSASCGLFVFRQSGGADTKATNPETPNKEKYLAARDKSCLFYESKSFPFIPQDFDFSSQLAHNGIRELFNTLKLVFSIIFIADISSLSLAEFSATIKGYKHISSSIKYGVGGDEAVASTYYEIYLWAYSEGSVTDKLGILRNLLSIHIDNDDFRDVRSGTMQAMVSNYSIYLKENVKQYIDIKNKLSDQIQKQSEKAGDMVKTIGVYLRTSVFSVYSFVVTTFIIRAMSKPSSEGMFTNGVYLIFLMFLVLSLGTLIYAYKESEAELERFKSIYQSFKTRYDDLLSKSDRDRILQNDIEFNRDCEYVKQSRKRAVILWGCALTAVFAFVSLVKVFKY
ncbi:hypothetical protein Q1J52_16720 [Pseudomonas lijiangensis]|uniref:hypothetical protein n=1 Tax=Pseudomonas lijiangensis TaxID=2995658 RepID=UPI0034D621E9